MSEWERRILVVEDSALLADLLRQTLEAAGFTVEVASDVQRAVAIADEADPDAVLLDIDLGPGPNGIAVAGHLRRIGSPAAIVFLTSHADLTVAGPGQPPPEDCAFLSKDSLHDTKELIAAIEAALDGRSNEWRHDATASGPLASLTATQRDTLRMLARGLTNSAIARRRGTSERAVEMLLSEAAGRLGILATTGVNGRVTLVRRYLELTGESPAAPHE